MTAQYVGRIIVVAVFALEMTACGTIESGPPGPTAAFPDPGQTVVAFHIDSGIDGTSLFVRETSNVTGQSTSADRALGAVRAFPIETHTAVAAPSWQIGIGTEGITLNQTGIQASGWTTNYLENAQASVQIAMSADGTVAYASKSGVDAVAPDGTVRAYTILPPSNCSPGTVGGHLPPPPPGVAVSWVLVQAVVFGPNGDVIVAAPGCDGPMLLNLITGRHSSVGNGCGRIEGMTSGSDGNLYLICLEAGSPVTGYPYVFAVVNYATLTTIRTASTGYLATGGTTFSMAVTDRAVYAYMTGQRSPGPAESHHLYELAFGSQTAQAVPIATTGEKIHSIGNGTLLFYPGTNGSDGNIVTRWNPSAGPMAQTATSRAMGPTGSWISAVFIG